MQAQAHLEAGRSSTEFSQSTTVPNPRGIGRMRFAINGMEMFKGGLSGLGIGAVISVLVGVGSSIYSDMSVAELIKFYPLQTGIVVGMPVVSGILNALLCNYTPEQQMLGCDLTYINRTRT